MKTVLEFGRESIYKRRTKRCSRVADRLHTHWKVNRGNRLIFVVMPQRRDPFPDNNSTDHVSLDTKISAALWRWRFADPTEQEKVIADSDLAVMLEYWFPFSDIPFTRQLGTWCDGIPLLTVSLVRRTTFLVTGVGYFPDQFSPFEICFHFPHRRSLQPRMIELRFGMLDEEGKLLSYSSMYDANAVFSKRPVSLQQWAVAVELTIKP